MTGGDIEARAALAAKELVDRLVQRHGTLVLAESCTAGLVSDLVGRISGASAVLWGSFVCYQAKAKERMLGIGDAFLRQHGLVSRETSREMAVRALELSGASVAAAVTGLAGPLSDGSDTPVGTVWVAVAKRLDTGISIPGENRQCEKELHFQGTRAEVRMQAATAVIEELLNALV